jgi:WD40 repeat protein
MIRIWNTKDGSMRVEAQFDKDAVPGAGSSNGINAVALDGSGSALAAETVDGLVKVWRIESDSFGRPPVMRIRAQTCAKNVKGVRSILALNASGTKLARSIVATDISGSGARVGGTGVIQVWTLPKIEEGRGAIRSNFDLFR